MIQFVSFIFSVFYHLYVRIYGKEFAKYWPTANLSFLTTMTLYDVYNVVLYFVNPEAANLITKYYKFFSLGLLFLFWYIVYRTGNRYKTLLARYDQMTKKSKFIMSILSIVFISTVIVTFFEIGNIYRAYNIGQR